MDIIGVAGQCNMGKDELCKHLVSELNKKNLSKVWKHTAFANAVKEVYCNTFGVSREFVEEWKRISEPPEGMSMNIRKSLQFIGDGFRQIKKNIWIETALRSKHGPIILSDSRYIAEAEHIKANSGLNIIIWRPGMENNDPNPSESEIKPIIDWCIQTNQNGPIFLNEFDLCDYEKFPDHIKYYDYFLRNDSDLSNLHRKIGEELIPWILRHYN